MTIAFGPITPILRIFDVAKADEYYLGFLGLRVDWDHRFDADAPLYRQVSRDGLMLHLSEHHGDGVPGTHLRVAVRGVATLQREFAAKRYRYMRPGLTATPWDTMETTVIDPFGNRITFFEPLADVAPQDRAAHGTDVNAGG